MTRPCNPRNLNSPVHGRYGSHFVYRARNNNFPMNLGDRVSRHVRARFGDEYVGVVTLIRNTTTNLVAGLIGQNRLIEIRSVPASEGNQRYEQYEDAANHQVWPAPARQAPVAPVIVPAPTTTPAAEIPALPSAALLPPVSAEDPAQQITVTIVSTRIVIGPGVSPARAQEVIAAARQGLGLDQSGSPTR